MARGDSRKRKQASDEEATEKPSRVICVKNNYKHDFTVRYKDDDNKVQGVTFPAEKWSEPIPEDVYLKLTEDKRFSYELNETGKFSMKAEAA